MPSFNATVETEVEVEFEVFCANCGAGLCSGSDGGNSSRRNMPYVNVTPCQNCIKVAKDEGYEEGYNNGYDTGFSDCENRRG